MTRERSPRRLRRRDRNALIAAALTALSFTASGCVVVHGERTVLPGATRAEAAKAVAAFTDAYNKADKAYDSSLDAPYVTGPLADIDAARLKAGHVNSPSGNASHVPLKLSDVKITIPKKAGWPRWFLADARGNKAGNYRWLLVFTRADLGERWRVAYLTLAAPGAVPRFKRDKDGWGEAVPASSSQLAVAPDDLSRSYVNYLKKGGKAFADGPNTSELRAYRQGQTRKPGLVRQYIDQPLTRGDYARWRCARRTAARWSSSPRTTTRRRPPPRTPRCRRPARPYRPSRRARSTSPSRWNRWPARPRSTRRARGRCRSWRR